MLRERGSCRSSFLLLQDSTEQIVVGRFSNDNERIIILDRRKFMTMLNFIDTRQGTRNQHTVGHGNTLPYTGVPFGMNHFVMQTRLNDGRFFNPDDYSTYGVRLTHQPSPWMGDYCQVLFNQLQVTEEEYARLQANPTQEVLLNLAMSSYRPDEAVFQPHYMSFTRLRDRLAQQWVVSERGARWQTTKKSRLHKHLLTIWLDDAGQVAVSQNKRQIYIETHQLAGSKYHQFGQYSVLSVNCEVTLQHTIKVMHDNRMDQVAIFELTDNVECVDVQLTTSYISYEQALWNQQSSDFFEGNFDQSVQYSAQLWQHYLSKIDVSHRDFNKVKTFYHCLWRTATFPQMAYEVTQSNAIVHQSPYTGNVEKGYFFTNNGYWDTFRTNYPLYTLIAPSMIGKFIDGILSVVKEDRFLPKWLSPDERGLMPGTLVDAVIADAIVKNLVDDTTATALLEAMIDSANHTGNHPTEGREGVAQYLALGYLSTDYHESVNKTLDFAYSDFCISQVARHLGKIDLAKEYEARSLSYRHLFNKAIGQMVPRTRDGQWVDDVASHRWGEHYTEGSAWQNSLGVYHNIGDLVNLYGGDEAFFEHLYELVNQDPIYDVNGYGYEIHEMTEMAKVNFGQLALSNQPSFHIPYLFSYAGYPQFSHLIIKQLSEHLFNSSVTGFIGDEDNGSMSSWYVLSSLGLYSVTPGSGEWTLGIQLWDNATIYLENGHTITLSSNQKQSPYLQVVTNRQVNGTLYKKEYVTHEMLMTGIDITQSLGVFPHIHKIENKLRPFSLNAVRND